MARNYYDGQWTICMDNNINQQAHVIAKFMIYYGKYN